MSIFKAIAWTLVLIYASLVGLFGVIWIYQFIQHYAHRPLSDIWRKW